MREIHFGKLDFKTPLIFTDGTDFFAKLGKKFITHKRGFFIMAPSGSGKTYFIDRQKEKHWMDGDSLWESANAHPKGMWWLESGQVIDEIDQRSDIITAEAKKMGFWIIGASNSWLKPDAIVLPHWSTHRKYIGVRGEATPNMLKGVLGHRRWIRKWVKKGVPCFNSVKEAADFLAKSYANSLSA